MDDRPSALIGLWLPLLAVALGGLFYITGQSMALRAENPATITVTGEGKVQAPPTVAELNFGVTTGPLRTAKEAITKLQADMNAVLQEVKKQGITDADVRTQQFSLYPQYDWSNNTQTLRGYEASQQLAVKVRDLEKVGTVLSAVTSAGANQSGGINFVIDEPDELRSQARAKAIDQAKEKAQELAQTLGMTLGKVKGFTENYGDPNMPPPIAYGRGGGGGGADQALSIPAGEQEVRVQVNITYELQ